ncbi:hypothetical protein BH20VER3_BH20VER3_14540 [soil metagenome]
MKKPILLILALSLPLAQIARADNDNDKRERPRQERDERPAQKVAPAKQGARPTQRRTAQPLQRPTRQVQRRTVPTQRSIVRTPRSVSPVQNRTAVRTEAELDGRTPRTRSGDSVRPNRGNRNFDRNSFDAARRRVIRTRHDRNWWRNRYNTTFILFGGGYYYWNAPYWYPAYGYSPIYNNYIYSEPIYGYDNLSPGEVIENVQLALREQGYYPGAIDGLVGPQTRAALGAYQRDNGLVITEAVDEPTLVTLGLA